MTEERKRQKMFHQIVYQLVHTEEVLTEVKESLGMISPSHAELVSVHVEHVERKLSTLKNELEKVDKEKQI